MPKSPFGGGSSGQPGGGGLQPTVSRLGSINTSGTTTPDTRGIGTLSIDLSGAEPRQQEEIKAEGLGAIPGLIADGIGTGVGATVGKILDVADQPRRFVSGELRKGAVLRAMGKDPGLLSNIANEISMYSRPTVTTASLAEMNKRDKEGGVPYALAKPFLQVGASIAAGFLGMAAQRASKPFTTGGRIPGGGPIAFTGGLITGPEVLSTDPETLPRVVRDMLADGATAEEAIDYMNDNFDFTDNDAAVDFVAGVMMDPLNWAGKPISFAQQIGYSKQVAKYANDGRTWQEMLVAGTLSKTEISVAKRVGLLGDVYNGTFGKVGAGFERVKQFMRASIADATMNTIGVEALNEDLAMIAKLGPEAESLYKENMREGVSLVLMSASKVPLNSNAANGAKNFAENILVAASKGPAGVRQIPELAGAPDSVVDTLVSAVKKYRAEQSDEAREALQKIVDDVAEQRNIFLINRETNGLFMNPLRRIPFVGKRYRQETIYASRSAMRNSIRDHELKVLRALEEKSLDAADLLRKEYSNGMGLALKSFDGPGRQVIDDRFEQILMEGKRLFNAGKKEDALEYVAKRMELARIQSYAKSVKVVRPLRKLTNMKITVVTANRFSHTTLSEAISELDVALKSGNKEDVATIVRELVIKYRDLSFSYDSIVLEDQLVTDAIKIGENVLRDMKRMMRLESYVTRLPDSLLSKMDEFEFGLEPAQQAKKETNKTLQTLLSIFRTSDANTAQGTNAISSLDEVGDISAFAMETTKDRLGKLANDGVDISGYNGFAVLSSDGLSVLGGGKGASNLKTIADLLGGSPKTGTGKLLPSAYPSSNPLVLRYLTEQFSGGVDAIRHGRFINRNEFAASGAPIIPLRDSVTYESLENPISELFPTLVDKDWGLRLSFADGGSVSGYDGLYSSGSNVVFKSSLKSNQPRDVINYLIWNKMNRSIENTKTFWNTPNVKFEKKNALAPVAKALGIDAPAELQTGLTLYDSAFIGARQTVHVMADNDKAKGLVNVIGKTKEGLNRIKSLPISERNKIFLDPNRLAAGFVLEPVPHYTIPDLDRTIVYFSEREKDAIVGLTELFRDLTPPYGNTEALFSGVDPLYSWMWNYMLSPLASLGNESAGGMKSRIIDMYASGAAPSWLKYIDNVYTEGGAAAPTIDIEASIKALTEELRESISAKAAEIDAVRSIDRAQTNDNLALNGKAYLEMASGNGDRAAISWSDIFHGMDRGVPVDPTNGPGLQSYPSDMDVEKLKDALSNSYYEFGATEPYLFQFLAHSDMIPTSYLSMVDEGGDAAKNAEVSEIIQRIKNGEVTLQDGYSQMAKVAMESQQFLSNTAYNAQYDISGYLHRFVERLGVMADNRMNILRNTQPGNGHVTMRVYDKSGSVLLEPRYTQMNQELTKILSIDPYQDVAYSSQIASPRGIIPERLRAAAVPQDPAFELVTGATKVAQASEIQVDNVTSLTPEEAAAELRTPGAKAARDAKAAAAEQQGLAELVKARAELRDLGYEMGIEPKQPYIQKLNVTTDIAGNAVIRPQFDMYTSIDEVADLSDFGIKGEDYVPLRGKSVFDKYKKMVMPISNNEIYDDGVDRLRVFLGGRISKADSLRSMANIVQRAIENEVNPGGLGNQTLTEIFVDAFGGGERGLRTYTKVFGPEGMSISPRSALLYALQGRPDTIGWTTNVAKRLQAKNEVIAMIAQKIYPLLRYRYNPYFNWQEGIEPYAFNILRGVSGEKAYEDGSYLSDILSQGGGAVADMHNVGPHVLLRHASTLQKIGQVMPDAEIAVGLRIQERAGKIGGEVADKVFAGSEKFRAGVSSAKIAGQSAGTLNELVRTSGPEIIRDQPEVGLLFQELTGTNDVASNTRYFIDQNINNMFPTQVLRIADVASAPYTWGAPIERSYLQPFSDVVSVSNPTAQQIENLEDISAVLEKVGGPIDLRKKLAAAAREFLASAKATPAGRKVISAGEYFKGSLSLTTVSNISTDVRRAVEKYTGNQYANINPYLGAKAEFGVQLNSRTRSISKMKAHADNTDNFAEMEELVGNIDEAIRNNHIVARGRMYRVANMLDFLNPSDIPNIKPGFKFGVENFQSFSKVEKRALGAPNAGSGKPIMLVVDDARGLPGIDLNAFKASTVGAEEEILFGRGMEYEVVEVLGKKPIPGSGKEALYVKVKPIMQPSAVDSLKKIAPAEAARVNLRNALSDIEIAQAKQQESFELLTKLLYSHPEIMEGVQKMGMAIKQTPQNIHNARYRKIRPSVPTSEIAKPDPNVMHDRYSKAQGGFEPSPQPAYMEPEMVFGTQVTGPQAALNTGGKTGWWMGVDGIKRYVKTVADPQPMSTGMHALVNEYIVTKLLKKMGVNVPEQSLVADNGIIYLASAEVIGKELKNIPIDADIAKQIVDNHVADLIVANFDVLGQDYKNIMVTPEGSLVRIDNGNSTFYRAGAGYKDNKKTGNIDPMLWSDVDPGWWWKPETFSKGSSSSNYKAVIEKAHPFLATPGASTLDIPNFLEQYTDMVSRLGVFDDAMEEILSPIRSYLSSKDLEIYNGASTRSDIVFGNAHATLGQRFTVTKDLLRSRISQLDSAVNQIRESRIADLNAQFGTQTPIGGLKKTRRPKLRTQDKWVVDMSERLAASLQQGITLPGLDSALQAITRGETLGPVAVNALSEGLAPFLYKRGATQQFMDAFAQFHAVATKRVFQEQMFSTHKGMLERTMNHPVLGPYPTSYMYGKVLPAFIDALFVYAPFTGEFAPLMGAQRLNQVTEYIAAELETNDELYEYVMRRPPLLMFLSGLLPGWPSDIGVSLPYWMREGIMRPIAEGDFESIPGKLADAAKTQIERQFGAAQTLNRSIQAVSEIQNFLTGDPSTSVLDDISEYLQLKDSN